MIKKLHIGKDWFINLSKSKQKNFTYTCHNCYEIFETEKQGNFKCPKCGFFNGLKKKFKTKESKIKVNTKGNIGKEYSKFLGIQEPIINNRATVEEQYGLFNDRKPVKRYLQKWEKRF
jgi:DNA-directed RNA polymerase subunit RPC12/RpoP